jgi:hypothetical protein
MRKQTTEPSKQLDRIRGQRATIRRKQIRLLQEELATLREQVRSVERELRQLGEPEAVGSAGRIRWSDVFEQLGDTFTAREMAKLTGARPMHIGTITHTWRSKGWIVATDERGVYRKTSRRKPD